MSAHTSEGAAHPSAGMTAFVRDLHGRAYAGGSDPHQPESALDPPVLPCAQQEIRRGAVALFLPPKRPTAAVPPP